MCSGLGRKRRTRGRRWPPASSTDQERVYIQTDLKSGWKLDSYEGKKKKIKDNIFRQGDGHRGVD